MTLGEILSAVYLDTGFTANPPADVQTRMKRWIQEGHETILRMPGMTDLHQGIVVSASVAAYPYLPISPSLVRVDQIIDRSSSLRLRQMSRDEFLAIDPAETASGTPTHWIPYGWQAVWRQSATTDVYAVSSSAADTTQRIAIAFANDTDPSQPQTADVLLTGTTRVLISNNVQWMSNITLSAACAGTISLFDAAAAGNLMSAIVPGQLQARGQVARLYPIPSTALTYTLEGQLATTGLTQPNDTPMLPPDYHSLLTVYARLREYERTSDDRYQIALALWTRGIQDLKAFVQFPPDFRPVAGRASTSGKWNNLGGFYPSGGW